MCVNVVFYFKFAFVWEGRGLVSGSLLFILGVGGSVVLKLNFVWGWFYLEFLGDYFLLRGFFFINFFSPFWGGTNICSTFTHSFTQFFSCIWGKCKCWTVCFFVFWATTAE